MISHNRRFLFVYVPKTGGNSVQDRLAKFSEDSIITPHDHQDGVERFEVANADARLTKHSTLSDYRDVIGWRLLRYFRFSTIRNPYDRLASYYFSPHRGVSEFDEAAFAKVIEEVPPLESYIRLGGTAGRLFAPQMLMRFEHLAEDFATVCDRIGVPIEELPVRNKSKRPPYTELYSAKTREAVESRFAYELKLGNYRY